MPNTNGHGPKKAILYARVSTDEQARSGYSLAQQIPTNRSSQRLRRPRGI
jgi:DNA invertase Pin-like site-specific DNA recombinase